jgi:hypothetical protein
MRGLAKEIEWSSPSGTWVREFAARHALKICRSQRLEEAKRLGCDTATIGKWFIKVSYLIESRDPRLVFNMDETQLAIRK